MRKYFCLLLVIIVLLNACTKENEIYTTASLKDYYPLQVGKYITYNLDSTVFIRFGSRDTIIHYQVKDSTDAQITDNLGRPAFRIVRFIRKDATKPWTPNNTFMAIPTTSSIEYVENNLRFLKLVLPIKQDYTWKGNGYLTIDPYPTYGFSSAFMDDWDYTYEGTNLPSTVGGVNLASTLTVLERDETLGDPKALGTLYAEKTYSIEKYAKNIGLVYKEFLHWEYQGNINAYKGFGVKLTMIDHN
jgi:hypothetical protein